MPASWYTIGAVVSCPVCAESIHDGGGLVACLRCNSPIHRECWEYNGERCARFGCGGRSCSAVSWWGRRKIGRPTEVVIDGREPPPKRRRGVPFPDDPDMQRLWEGMP